MKRIRIVLADDHVLILNAIKAVLEVEFDVVGTFADGPSLLRYAPSLHPDLIVLDINMPLMNGLTIGGHLKDILPDVKLIYLTMSNDPDVAAEALRLGASGYLLKNSDPEELVQSIGVALQGKAYVTPLIKEELDRSLRNPVRHRNHEKLTLRQKEVLQLLAEGRSMKEAAFVLNVTPRTVAFHKYSMMNQLHLRTSAELIQFAVLNSICSPKSSTQLLPQV